MAARTPVVIGSDGLPQQLQPVDTLASGLRMETYTGTCDASGVASITFSPAFKSKPLAFLIEDWAGTQMICGKVTSATATGCAVQGMVSRATLLLSAGPFTTAPSGTVVTVAAIGV